MTSFAELDLAARTDKLEKAVDEIRKLGDQGERTEQRVKKSTNAMSVGFGKLAGVISGAVASIASMQTVMASVTAARQFNAALAETSTLIDGIPSEMALISEGARAMSREFGGNATSQVQAYYQAISAGAGDAAAATKLLDAANRLAIGGVTTVTNGVDVLTTATNAYRATGLTAAQASDALFVGMRAGKTTITELSASIGQVLPVATSLGVSFDETVAAMSALTTQGIGTAQAATGVRSALTSMIAPTDQAQKLAKQLGIEFSAAGVEALGFGGMMDQIIQKTGGSTELIQQLFGSIEATTAALSFAGGAGQVFNDIMGQMAEKTGATDAAFNLMAQSLDQRLKVVLAQSADLLLGLGNALLAVIVPAAETAIAAVNYLGENLAAAGVVIIALAATQIPALTVALYAKVTAMAAAATGAGILTGAMRALGAAVALAGGPFGLLLGILGGAAAAMVLFRDNTATAAPIMDEAKSAVDRINAVLANSSEVALPAAARATLNLTNENIKLAKSAYAAAEAELAKAKAAAQYAQTELGLQQAFSPTGQFTQAESDLSNAMGNLTRAQSDLLIQQDRLTQRINEGQLSLSGASEAMAENQRRAVDLTVTMGDLNNAIAGSGGGAGAGGSDPFQQRLEALQQGLMTEREVVDAWYQESMDLLNDRRAMELLGEEEHKQALLRVEEEYQRQLAELRGANNNAALEGAASFFGSMAEVAQAGGERMTKVARVFGAAQALINTYLAASQALADPRLGFFAKFAAVAKVVATGMGLVNAIRGGGSSGGGGGGASAPATREATPERAAQQRFLRIEVNGDGMFADMLRDNVQSIADAIVSEQRAGGTTIVVGR
jgi:TP901 family phage tail tape measure protein